MYILPKILEEEEEVDDIDNEYVETDALFTFLEAYITGLLVIKILKKKFCENCNQFYVAKEPGKFNYSII